MNQSTKAEILKELNRPIIKSGRVGSASLTSLVSVRTYLQASFLAIMAGMALGVCANGGQF